MTDRSIPFPARPPHRPEGDTTMHHRQAATTSAFPVIDGYRGLDAAGHPHRVIQDYFGFVEAAIVEADGWVAMPLRLVHSQAGGWEIELGPYTLDAADILKLREAIAAHDRAVRA